MPNFTLFCFLIHNSSRQDNQPPICVTTGFLVCCVPTIFFHGDDTQGTDIYGITPLTIINEELSYGINDVVIVLI